MPNKTPEAKQKNATTEAVKVTITTAKAKPDKAGKSGAVVRFCSCASKFQDSRYGNGKRVFTCGPKNGIRCSVCGRSAGN
jgi:hypothetical protein